MRGSRLILVLGLTACQHRVFLDDVVCSGHAGPSSVRVEGTCIDSTEVTRGQYEAFLKDAPAPSEQAAECAWNADFVPADWPAPAGSEQYPVGGVDFCDARAFCRWAGKRLCGRLGGGSVFWRERGDATTSEWYVGCSKQAAKPYPYGSDFKAESCAVTGDVRPVGALSGCQGGYAGLFDMIGNVWEWTDSCDAEAGEPSLTLCDRRGGSTTVMPPEIACADGELLRRNAQLGDTGIRCCSD